MLRRSCAAVASSSVLLMCSRTKKQQREPEKPIGDSVLADLEAGENPVLLGDLPKEPYMPRGRGRKGQRRPLHWSVPYRWATSGKNGEKLETLQTPSGAVTTKSAVLRFFSALSSGEGGGGVATPGKVRREHERASKALDAIGIG